ncbi:MAG: hypothetical protein JRF33_11265 [Deltaproteobacteria bacterium]|nr:hypothetical protein [Deltaproteobacteria bacterium]
MVTRPVLRLLLVFWLGLLPCQGSALPSSTEAVHRARQVAGQPAYQKDVPESDSQADPQSQWNKKDRGFHLHRSAPVGAFGASLVHLLFYLAMGLALGLALLWIVATWHGRKTATRPKGLATHEDHLPAGSEPKLDFILGLAGQGRYAEAVHQLLLLAVLQLMRQRARDGLADSSPGDSLTSRELLQVLPKDDSQRRRFALLVSTAERALFAGQSLGVAAFDDCLENYRGLAL